ncbi:MAG: IS21 family transposase [Alphaproteobacteria bacterium]|nr:IS21 family transposase [Alphaproteobacteria bacterium]
MRKIGDVLRLRADGLSKRKIAASLSIGVTTAGEIIRRVRRAGLSWPLPENLSDEALERVVYPPTPVTAKDRRPQPDWAAVHRELRRPGVTLQLTWEEYREAYPDGYGYSRYCDLYRSWEQRLSPTMRQLHVAGERTFVDYGGTTLEVVDGTTGEVRECQLFVAVLGASSFTFAEATFSQRLFDWIGSHVRAFAFFGGVTAQTVSDNLRSGVSKACFYEPAVNRTYSEMAAHYGTAIVPARPGKPRDKAKVEVAVQVATRWIVAKLRNRRFFSLSELNAAISELTTQLDARVTRHLGTSRRALFDEIERPALKPLPVEPYVYAEWKQCKVGFDYHVEVEHHYYSVPHTLLRETVWVRVAAQTVEVFHRGNRVAVHLRASSDRRHTTIREHMPSSHRRYADWTPERIRRQAGEIGRNTAALVEIIMRERPHPEQGFRASVGIIRLAKSYGRERLEAACGRALEIGARSYTSVNSILRSNLDAKRPAAATDGPSIGHSNIRGPGYFH